MSIAKITKIRSVVQSNGLLHLNSGKNTSSSLGLVGEYTSDGSKYAGLFRDNAAGAWNLFDSLSTNPLLSDSVSTGYSLSALNVGQLNAPTLNSTTITGSSDISIGGSGLVKLTNAVVNAAPTASLGIANKSYVDSLVQSAVQGWVAKASVVARTVSALVGTVVASGSGATKTISISGPTQAQVYAVFDGVVVRAGDRVLIANQGAQQDNGIYVAQAGFGITSWTLLRATDANTTSELTIGAHVFVEGGALYSSTGWVLQGPFSQFAIDVYATGVSYIEEPQSGNTPGAAYQVFGGTKYWLDYATYVALGSPSVTGVSYDYSNSLPGLTYSAGMVVTSAQSAQYLANAAALGAQVWVKFSNTFMAAANIGAGVGAFSSLVGTQFQFNSLFAAQTAGTAGLLTVDSTSNANGVTYKIDQSKLTGTGALASGSIASGFGTIATSSAISGSSLASSGALSVAGASQLSGGLTVTNAITTDKITTSAIVLTDALSDSMDIKSASQQFISFCTAAGLPSMTFAQATKLLSTLSVAGASTLHATSVTDLSASTATISGNLRLGVMELSASTTLDSTMSIVNVTTGSSAVTITLPPAAANAGRIYKLLKPDSGVGAVSIVISSGDLIDGDVQPVMLSAQYDHARFTSHGASGWYLH